MKTRRPSAGSATRTKRPRSVNSLIQRNAVVAGTAAAAQAGDRDAHAFEPRRHQIEQHVPGGIGEEGAVEIMIAQPAGADQRADRRGIEIGRVGLVLPFRLDQCGGALILGEGGKRGGDAAHVLGQFVEHVLTLAADIVKARVTWGDDGGEIHAALLVAGIAGQKNVGMPGRGEKAVDERRRRGDRFGGRCR